ncbi:olfactory receptor 13C9-like [Monodelphis domestica]|uniref:olfactory receptor 13C9-like n=1 Tax=Monodelphis domestica TaxID=13616 RepID=UPI0000D9474A|nr:olfactory receptor 13C9-like [Monodelphis domestica]
MEGVNWTSRKEFVLLGFSDYPKTEMLIFILCLIMYLVILMGNSIIIVLTILDCHLHTPMYFFLSNLSFLDICFTSFFVPKMLTNFLSESKTISFCGCMIQMYITLSMGATECVLLATMAYDRYVAICNPLRYPIIMNKRLCVQLVVTSWVIGFLDSAMETALIIGLPFCGKNIINHFACELLAILKLVCVDISLNEIILLIDSITFVFSPLLLIITSYIFILSAILRINSAEGRKKAFSTCSSHLTVVTVFYGTILFMYMKPRSKNSIADKFITLFYSLVTPMLNPIIYTLRNKEVNRAMRNVLKRLIFVRGL